METVLVLVKAANGRSAVSSPLPPVMLSELSSGKTNICKLRWAGPVTSREWPIMRYVAYRFKPFLVGVGDFMIMWLRFTLSV